MNEREIIISSLHEEFCRSEMNPIRKSDRIIFSPLGFEFRIANYEATRNDTGMILDVVFEAAQIDNVSTGLCVHSIGSGKTIEEASRGAANQWFAGVFPVLHSYSSDHDTDLGVKKAEFLVEDTETKRRYGWKAHLGQVIAIAYGEGYSPEEIDQLGLFQAIFNEISAVTAHESIMWLEMFAAQYPDGKVDATCILRNQKWEDGRIALLRYASQWPNQSKQLLSRRQFIILEPVKQNMVNAELGMKLDEHVSSKKSLLSRLLRRNK